jgi:hypothetical protein
VSAVNLIPIEKAFSRTQVNCVIFRKDSISSYEDTQVVSFYDSKKRVTFAQRKLGEKHWLFMRLNHKGRAMDAHNCISILHDSNGILHASFDHHNHPLRYRITQSKNAMNFTKPLRMTGINENRVCYPQFYRDSKLNFYFFYRDGKSGNGNLNLKKFNSSTKVWKDIHTNLIDGENERNAYWQIWIDDRDIIHLSWVWRESGDASTNHDICYAKSLDGGITWRKSNNKPQNLPITQKNADYALRIPQKAVLINQTSMIVDTKGNPYIATFFRPEGEIHPQYMIVYFRNGRWNTTKICHNPDNFDLKGGGTLRFPLSRPLVLIDKKDIVYLVFRAKARNDVISIAKAASSAMKNWKIQDLTKFSVNTWEPTIDSSLWKKENKLHLLVQNTGYYKYKNKKRPQMLYILEYCPNKTKN